MVFWRKKEQKKIEEKKNNIEKGADVLITQESDLELKFIEKIISELDRLSDIEANLWSFINNYDNLPNYQKTQFKKEFLKLLEILNVLFEEFNNYENEIGVILGKNNSDHVIVLIKELKVLNEILRKQHEDILKFDNEMFKKDILKILKSEISQEFSNVSIQITKIKELLNLNIKSIREICHSEANSIKEEEDKNVIKRRDEKALKMGYDRAIVHKLGFEIDSSSIKDPSTGLIWKRRISQNITYRSAKAGAGELANSSEIIPLFNKLRDFRTEYKKLNPVEASLEEDEDLAVSWGMRDVKSFKDVMKKIGFSFDILGDIWLDDGMGEDEIINKNRDNPIADCLEHNSRLQSDKIDAIYVNRRGVIKEEKKRYNTFAF